MTESAAFSSAARKDCFNEFDVEMFEFVAALDHHTCDLCGEMDGKVFKMSEYQVGVTAEPLHPCCRCTTAPYFEDMAGLGERYARDIETGETCKVPSDMTYKQWKAKQDEKYGAGSVDLARKKEYNKSTDKTQYQSYKEALGKDAPATFEEFQNTKYSDSDNWNALKQQYRSSNTKVVTKKAEKSGIIKSLDVDDYGTVTYGKNISKEVSDCIIETVKSCEKSGKFYISEVYANSLDVTSTGTPVLQIEPLSNGLLRLNLNTDVLSDRSLDDINKMFSDSKNTVVQSLKEAVIHESGHAMSIYGKNISEIQQLYDELSGIHIDGISKIAYNDGAECLAELEVLKHRGVDVSSEAKAFYKKYMRREYN